MLQSQRRRTCREVTGPTPHAVAVRAKFPSSRPADHLILDQQKQDSIRDQVLLSTKHQQACEVKTSWLQSSDRRFLKGTVDRRVRQALDQQGVHLDQRRDRLRELLQEEEQQLLQEAQQQEEEEETGLEVKMRERAKILKGERERDRQQLVSEKLEQLCSDQCDEGRSLRSRRLQQQVSRDRAAQVSCGLQRRQEERQEERQLEELWEADRRAKEEQEARKEEARRQSNQEQLDAIRTQMEGAELRRQEHRQLKEEEAELRLQQQETLRLQDQQQQHQALLARRARLRQLDRSLKEQRGRREQQDDHFLSRDGHFLPMMLQQEGDEQQAAAHRKAEHCEEQRLYRQHLATELQQRRREEQEEQQLMEEALTEVRSQKEQRSRQQGAARRRLVEEVMEARRLQVQHKIDLNQQKQTEFSKERDELNKMMEETKLMEEEEKRRLRQTSEAYRSALGAQVQQQQQLRAQLRDQVQKEHQQSLILQDRSDQRKDQRKDQVLTGPGSHSPAPHPFRRGGGTGSASRHQT